MKKLIYGVAAIFCFASFTQAQAVSGAYTTSIGGKVAVTESYALDAKPDGSMQAEAEIVAAGGPKQKLVTVAAKGQPFSFTVEVNSVKVLTADFSGTGAVKLAPPGQTARELPTKASVVLENLVWHHFHFLLPQYDEAKGGGQKFTFFVPTQAREFEMVLERTSAPAYKVKDREIKTRRYRAVTAGQLVLDLWTDDAGTPLLFAVPSQNVQAIRQGAEALASVAFGAGANTSEWQPPAYAHPASFREQEVTVGAGGEWPLPGTLTLPNGQGTFPAVVLVHGSGPNDRDETIGGNKPFRDLAWGLASRGVAVLRYDKRTKAQAARVAQAGDKLTIKEEVIDDALAAVELLRRAPGIDARRIFLLGHSLGGTLAPRIATSDPKLAGLIIMAGATGAFEDAIVRQYEYLAALDGTVSEAERTEIDKVKQQAARVKSLTATGAQPAAQELFNVPAAYWLSLRDYHPPTAVRKLQLPLLILQGERDYQVTLKDFQDWQRTLGETQQVTFKSYPKLNHLFLEGAGPGTPAEYATPGHVAQDVIEDIAGWIGKSRRQEAKGKKQKAKV